MRKTLGILVAVCVIAACRGKGNLTRRGQQYDVVQEGSASGVTSTINGPGETPPPVNPTPITGTSPNADTTTNFTLPTPEAGAPQQPGTLAGTMPPQTGRVAVPGAPPSRAPQVQAQPQSQPRMTPRPSVPAPVYTPQPRPTPTAPPTDTARSTQPPPSTDTTATAPPATTTTSTTTTSTDTSQPENKRRKSEKPPANSTQPPPDQPPPPPPTTTDTRGNR